MACAYITDLATFIWNDLGQPSDEPTSYIQSKLVSNGYIGQLNSFTASCFSGISGDISPSLGADEQALYALMYEKDYYTKKLNQTLAGLNPGVITLQEGDSRVTFASPIEKARLYRDMQKQLNDQLIMLTSAYRQDRSTPVSVDYMQIISSLRQGYDGPFPRGYYRN